MADELTLNFSMRLQQAGVDFVRAYEDLVTKSGDFNNYQAGEATTSYADLPKGSVGTVGYVYVRNMDSTDDLWLATNATGSDVRFATLKPGEGMLFRFYDNSGAFDLRIRSSANTPIYESWIQED